MMIDEAIRHYEQIAENQIKCADRIDELHCDSTTTRYMAEHHRQLVEWLSELQRWREFGDWVVKAVLDDDWEDNADFYAEVLCRKLTKLGKLKLVDNKYMEVNADERR